MEITAGFEPAVGGSNPSESAEQGRRRSRRFQIRAEVYNSIKKTRNFLELRVVLVLSAHAITANNASQYFFVKKSLWAKSGRIRFCVNTMHMATASRVDTHTLLFR